MRGTYLLVELGGERYAIAVQDVLEVGSEPAPVPLPGAPAGVLGLQNVRGEVLPLLDLAALVGAGQPGSAAAMVVVEQSGRRAVLAVDRLRDVTPLEIGDARDETGPLRSSGLVDGSLVGVIDTAAVFASVETGTAT